MDLYWSHFWDQVTPVEELVQSLSDLVRVGKIRYYGFSDVPAWYAAKGSAYAHAHGLAAPIGLQIEYSLVERMIEWEHLAAASDCGLGVCTWGPLAAGFLTGKYARDGDGVTGSGRFESWKPFRKFADGHWATLDAVRAVAAESGKTPSQVAVTWLAGRPGVTSVLLGASKPEQFRETLATAGWALTADQRRLLDETSERGQTAPFKGFTPEVQKMIFGGKVVEGWR